MSKVAFTYGDGIGPEIMKSVIAILEASGANLKFEEIKIGRKVYDSGNISGIDDDTWRVISDTHVILKAPLSTPQGKGLRSVNVRLRKELGLYANVRHCYDFFSSDKNVDIVVVRENSEDLYAGIEYRQTHNTFCSKKIISTHASERICKYAFEYARLNKRKKVTCLVKDNIMKISDGAFNKVFKDVSALYPEIKSESYILDIGAAYIATKPENFDVIVTLNLYGDVISDITAELAGSVGMSSSLNIGKDYAMFEAVHGTAPDIAGQNIANPSGLLNAAMHMLCYLGQQDIAYRIYNAWITTMKQGIHTADVYDEAKSKKKVGTTEFTEAVISNIKTSASEKPENFLTCFSGVLDCDFSYEGTRVLKGVDFYISCTKNQLYDFIEKVLSVSDNTMKMEGLYVIGTKIWPNLPLAKLEGFDVICSRFLVKSGVAITNQDISNLLKSLCEKGIEVVSLENLYTFDDTFGFCV